MWKLKSELNVHSLIFELQNHKDIPAIELKQASVFPYVEMYSKHKKF